MNVFASHQILCSTASHLLPPLYTPSSESSESESAWVSRSSVTDGKLRNRCSELNEERWVCRLPEDERLNEPDAGSAESGSGGELSSSSEETMMGGGFRLVCELCDHFFTLAAEATIETTLVALEEWTIDQSLSPRPLQRHRFHALRSDSPHGSAPRDLIPLCLRSRSPFSSVQITCI